MARMQHADQNGAATRAGHHATLYRLLQAGAAAERVLPPGTEGAIGRAQTHYESDPEAAALLRAMNLAAFRLRQALFAGDEEEIRTQRETLSRLGDSWLYHAPLFHVAELLPAEGLG